jgi:hypothetical protein
VLSRARGDHESARRELDTAIDAAPSGDDTLEVEIRVVRALLEPDDTHPGSSHLEE